VVQCALGGCSVGRCHAGWVVIEDVELAMHSTPLGTGPWQNAAESKGGSGNEHAGRRNSVLAA
jgi:hypothetical protein